MREILFRGKTIVDNEWMYGSLIFDKDLNKQEKPYIRERNISIATTYFYGGSGLEVIPKTVGQKTCFKDRKDQDIYEGDILKHTLELDGEIMEQNYLVKFEDGAFRLFQRLDQPWSMDILNRETIEFENFVIIGNIYDNPELMEV